MFKFFQKNVVPVVGYVSATAIAVGTIVGHERSLCAKEKAYREKGLATERVRRPFKTCNASFQSVVLYRDVDVRVVDNHDSTSCSIPK